MGQRHQIFVKIPNPVKYRYYRSQKEKKEAEAEFGTADTTVIAYHNGWLFGRSALQSCLNLLNFSNQFEKETKTDPKSWGGYHCPFTINGLKQTFTAKKAIETIAFIMNFRPVKTAWLDAGIGETRYIGFGEDFDGIREDFTIGDNDDGITIIDLIENKYCFMNIYEQDIVDNYRASRLPKLVPVDARTYVAAYYGETIETTNPFYFGDHDRSKVTMPKEKQQKFVDRQIKINAKIAKGFEKFGVLTIDEVQAMFAKVRLPKKKAAKKKKYPKISHH